MASKINTTVSILNTDTQKTEVSGIKNKREAGAVLKTLSNGRYQLMEVEDAIRVVQKEIVEHVSVSIEGNDNKEQETEKQEGE